jgi:hypothetical protein
MSRLPTFSLDNRLTDDSKVVSLIIIIIIIIIDGAVLSP